MAGIYAVGDVTGRVALTPMAIREGHAVADTLFGKRSEVKDAHDRYANIEVGYLLQKMDEFEGIAILATNLRQNMDDAFIRRLQVVVEFPFAADARVELL